MMGLEESYLLDRIQAELKAVSARMHADARRCETLKRGRLMLGTGVRAAVVKELVAYAFHQTRKNVHAR